MRDSRAHGICVSVGTPAGAYSLLPFVSIGKFSSGIWIRSAPDEKDRSFTAVVIANSGHGNWGETAAFMAANAILIQPLPSPAAIT